MNQLEFLPLSYCTGRSVRAPMKILKEIWTGDDSRQKEVRTTYEYVINLRDKLESTMKIAQENLKNLPVDTIIIMTGKRN